MLRKIGIITILLLLSASLALAAASEEKIDATKKDIYTVEPAAGSDGDVTIQTVYATITQGQTNWHSKYVNTYITALNVDLNWGNSANSLRLKIYSPDGYVFGPYYDSADGTINGRINLVIRNPNGIARGTWYYEVYGYNVIGTEDYYI